jgi:hypothetical protein
MEMNYFQGRKSHIDDIIASPAKFIDASHTEAFCKP